MRAAKPARRVGFKHQGVLPRFRDAFRGCLTAYREEPNLRFHVFAASGAAIAGWAVRLVPWETAYLAGTVGAVILAELVNTAIERTVDLASGGERHPLAARAKEVAAGAVLLAAVHAAFVGSYLFAILRNPWDSARAVLDLLAAQPWVAALPLVTGVAGVLGAARSDEKAR